MEELRERIGGVIEGKREEEVEGGMEGRRGKGGGGKGWMVKRSG